MIGLFLMFLSCFCLPTTFAVVPHSAGEHAPLFYHTAFLGFNRASQFSHLSPEESKHRLIDIVEQKIDIDKDGRVIFAELLLWLNEVAHSEREHGSSVTFTNYKALNKATNSDAPMTFLEYANAKRIVEFGDNQLTAHQETRLKRILNKEKGRWAVADENGDGVIDKSEFLTLTYPYEFKVMHPQLIKEKLDRMDTNQDGNLTMEEYVSYYDPKYALYQNGSMEKPLRVDELELTFKEVLDKDGDGILNSEEVAEFAVPDDSSFAVRYAKHFFIEADEDKDEALTTEEFLNKTDLFVPHYDSPVRHKYRAHNEL